MDKIKVALVDLAILVQKKITETFLPTAIKFHYNFNLRDLTNVFQPMVWSTPAAYKTPASIVRLYLHEAERVYC